MKPYIAKRKGENNWHFYAAGQEGKPILSFRGRWRDAEQILSALNDEGEIPLDLLKKCYQREIDYDK